eukprot:764346-Hanusia_phi.AAC.3
MMFVRTKALSEGKLPFHKHKLASKFHLSILLIETQGRVKALYNVLLPEVRCSGNERTTEGLADFFAFLRSLMCMGGIGLDDLIHNVHTDVSYSTQIGPAHPKPVPTSNIQH